MNENSLLTIRVDRNSMTKEISGSILIISILIGVILFVLTSDFISAPLKLGTVLPAALILLQFAILPRYLKERRDTPIIYTFDKNGFTSHQVKKSFTWADFGPFYYSRGGLYLPLHLEQKGTNIILSHAGISKQSYKIMMQHIKYNAPFDLTRKVEIPK